LLITKIDLLEKDKKIKNIPQKIPVFNISSIANINLDKTINEMYNHIG